jgi:dihydroorotate dehydrogenase
MSSSERLAKLDRIGRPFLSMLSPRFFIDFYSRSRREFLMRLSNDEPRNIDLDSWIKPVRYWDIQFNSPLFNAAGMFKSGNGYNMCALQGAGAWLAGTSTSHPRAGNKKNDILHPFLTLPRTNSAVNWLGLPNDGHSTLAGKIQKIEKVNGCPIGVSVSADPDENYKTALPLLVDGMKMLVDSGTDFIELNESCPNVTHHANLSAGGLDTQMLERLEYIQDKFLKSRMKNTPVIVKYSVDTEPQLLSKLLPILVELGFDGINLGNTSTTYSQYLPLIHKREKSAYSYFTTNFGGGVSGKLIKEKSLELCSAASSVLKEINLKKEFLIIRTGGIENAQDLIESENAGAVLNQWYTGFFENFSLNGHKLYKKIFSND